MYFHCIRSLHFLRAVSNSFLDSARLHPLHILVWFPYVFALYTFVTLFRGLLIFFFQHTDLVYICHILRGGFPIYFHCIRSLHFLRAVSNSFLDSARLHPLHILRWFPYVFPLYTFVTLFESWFLFFFRFSLSTSVTYTKVVSLCICIVYVRYTFQRIPDIYFFLHTDLVYICYILWGGFSIYFHCIRSLHSLRAVSNSFLDSARLHLLHIFGWFPYVFALYTFVTLFRGFLIFFFNIQILYTSVTSYGVFFLCNSIVYVRYSFWELYLILF